MERKIPRTGIDALMNPRSIAILGASRDTNKWGRRVLDNLINTGYCGQIFGVNPSFTSLDTIPGAYAVNSMDEIEANTVDLAFLALPAHAVPDAAMSCINNQVGSMVITTSGFSEVGQRGRVLQDRLLRARDNSRCRIIGPNSFGFYTSSSKVNLTPHNEIPPGRVALLSQSGNVAIAMSVYAKELGYGYSHSIGLGNQADIGLGELLAYLSDDTSCDIIACYVEGLGPSQGKQLLAGLEACKRSRKPVVMLRGGRSVAGSKGVASHTGTLASSDRAWRAVLSKYGVSSVSSTEEMASVLKCMSDIPATAGRVMVMTNGGGDSILATDAISDAGLHLARPEAGTRRELETLTPVDAPRSALGNPLTLDTAGGVDDDPLLLARCARVAARDPNIDIIVIAGLFGGYHHLRDREIKTAKELSAISKACPIAVQSAYASENEEPLEFLKRSGIPVFGSGHLLMDCLAKTTCSTTNAETEPSETRRSTPQSQMAYRAAANLMESYGIKLPYYHIFDEQTRLDDVASDISYPCCLKLASENIIHKSDVGGVVLGIRDFEELVEQYSKMRNRFGSEPLLVSPMIGAGFEMIVGTMHDQELGPMVMVGRGGVWAELEDDVQISLAPIDEPVAQSMIKDLRCFPILRGYRGSEPYDLSGLAGLLAKLSRIATAETHLNVEMNPVIVTVDDAFIADLRVMRDPMNQEADI